LESSRVQQVVISGKLGDGSLVCQSKKKGNYCIMFSAVHLDYLLFKRDVLQLFVKATNVSIGKSGYKVGGIHYRFSTRVHPMISAIGNLSISECIEQMSLMGLVMFYLDDGTYHQRKHFMNLYCNTFSDKEIAELIAKIYQFYPVKICAKRWDRKKDGRKYPYLYIPVSTANMLKKDVAQFLLENEIYSMLYKVGLPSTTIESISKECMTCSLERSE